MKIRDTHSLLLLLMILILSGCGEDDSDDDGTLNINEIVDNVEAVIGGGSGSGGGAGLGGGLGGPIGNCSDVTSINPNSTTSGELSEASSCQLQDFFNSFGGGEATDGYVVDLPSDGTFTIIMRSEEFDSFLFLYLCNNDSCSTKSQIDTNDDSGGGLDAAIVVDLTAGTYLILASEFTSSEPDGNYILTATFDGGPSGV